VTVPSRAELFQLPVSFPFSARSTTLAYWGSRGFAVVCATQVPVTSVAAARGADRTSSASNEMCIGSPFLESKACRKLNRSWTGAFRTVQTADGSELRGSKTKVWRCVVRVIQQIRYLRSDLQADSFSDSYGFDQG